MQGAGNEKAATAAVTTATAKETNRTPQVETIKPSFNCAKATTSQEKAICSNADLAELDNRLARAYSKASSACKKGQKEWLNERESCSASISCLKNTYKTRINELESCR